VQKIQKQQLRPVHWMALSHNAGTLKCRAGRLIRSFWKPEVASSTYKLCTKADVAGWKRALFTALR